MIRIFLRWVYRCLICPILRRTGYELVEFRPPASKPVTKYPDLPRDFDERMVDLFRSVEPYTMISPENVACLSAAVRHIVEQGVQGAFVECGVWRGGSVMAMVKSLLDHGVTDRDIYLYDTFAGMSEPTSEDICHKGERAMDRYGSTMTSEGSSSWARCSLEDVKRHLSSTGYPFERFHFVEGKVEETLPSVLPERIALLRLDTDWYESTRHELTHLYPLVAPGGFVIIDDYAHWLGSRKAVDEYIAEHRIPVFLFRIDRWSRMWIKP